MRSDASVAYSGEKLWCQSQNAYGVTRRVNLLVVMSNIAFDDLWSSPQLPIAFTSG